jgi:NAD(P)-dependent dehydrogenase (short-subunit alcohol dehydrogenase family)
MHSLNHMARWTVQDIPSQTGKLAIITGSTGGLGYETALGLARADAAVVLAGRNHDKGGIAVEKILGVTPKAKVRFEMLDLASLASIRGFAEKMLAQARPLDMLINNAGVMALPTRRLTADGFELQFGTNHLGHFALAGLLLPLLKSAVAARVTTVSSLAHQGGRIDFDNLQGERGYNLWTAYQQSKLANLLFALELQRRSDSNQWNVISNAAHPGYARTELISNGLGKVVQMPLNLVLRPFNQSSVKGALPILFAVTSSDAVPMGYYGPDGMFELKGYVAPAAVSHNAKDEAAARRLWEISEKLTGVEYAL